ncbi:SRPBCC family protein [Tychonema sp. LEGE 07199]|uniref:SRPBCC family protein n=1 Tax=unclassified Tychonema TaxID=2642144 RepID=UPI00188043E2|nr:MULTISPECIES: SRPBCC family protein [unclassified Tychonema]MBE9122673.1 SRPBCC family protein [Tychonema sp. LEGE 07199]MBE9132298.1 SRPBCC family protein [Tychonema sp. LEGE 07196]
MDSNSIANSDKENQTNTGEAERWASLIGGGALVLFGLSQRSLRGALLAVAGGGLAARGLGVAEGLQSAADANQSIKVEKTVTIDKPADELYRFWRDFENLPRFMKHLKHVAVIDDKRSHWIASAPAGNSVEWDAEIVREEENRLIAWVSVEGADVENSGFVRFQPAPAGRGTEVKVAIEYNPPGGAIAGAAAKLFGEAPEQQIADDLRRFKQFMETGEIATTAGQSSGRN